MASLRSPWIPAAVAAAGLLGALLWLTPSEPGRGRPGREARSEATPRAGGAAGKLAIVIDDVGYEMAPVRALVEVKAALSFAVIPHQKASRRAAELVHRNGREVLLHLPMEPVEYPRHQPGEGALLASMDAPELRQALRQALDAVPYARGLSNHMGSRLTADPQAMELLMRELAGRGLFFLDSRTGSHSVALAAARSAKVPCVERNVFLDARRGPRAISEQLQRAVQIARRDGAAVAIGHPYPDTLEVLRRELPRLAGTGVDLVFASELAS